MSQLIILLLVPVVFAVANRMLPFLADVRLGDDGIELTLFRRFVVRRYAFGSVREIERVSMGEAIRSGRIFEHGLRWTGRLRLHYVILDLRDGRVVTMTPRRDREFVAEVRRRMQAGEAPRELPPMPAPAFTGRAGERARPDPEPRRRS